MTVISIIDKEYNLIDPSDDLDSMAFEVPARIGPNGVEKIYELPVDDIREQIERSANFIKEDIKSAKGILRGLANAKTPIIMFSCYPKAKRRDCA
ncbi:MAG: hypothetical protein PVG39_26745 [Desulfobacteraceae bacterium]